MTREIISFSSIANGLAKVFGTTKKGGNLSEENPDVKILLAEVERLRPFEEQVKDIEEFVNQEEPLNFMDAKIKKGKVLDAIVHGAFARLFINAMVRLFIDSGSKNYLEIELQKVPTDNDAEPITYYTMTIQKKTGITPAQKATMYEEFLEKILMKAQKYHEIPEMAGIAGIAAEALKK